MTMIQPGVDTRMDTRDVSTQIAAWKKEHPDFPWSDFSSWFMTKYGLSATARTPTNPERFYKSFDVFLKDVAQFEKEEYGAVISDVGREIADEYDEEEVVPTEPEEEFIPPEPGEEYIPPPPDDLIVNGYYIPPPPQPEKEFPWTIVAVGAGALVVALLLLKK